MYNKFKSNFIYRSSNVASGPLHTIRQGNFCGLPKCGKISNFHGTNFCGLSINLYLDCSTPTCKLGCKILAFQFKNDVGIQAIKSTETGDE